VARSKKTHRQVAVRREDGSQQRLID